MVVLFLFYWPCLVVLSWLKGIVEVHMFNRSGCFPLVSQLRSCECNYLKIFKALCMKVIQIVCYAFLHNKKPSASCWRIILTTTRHAFSQHFACAYFRNENLQSSNFAHILFFVHLCYLVCNKPEECSHSLNAKSAPKAKCGYAWIQYLLSMFM